MAAPAASNTPPPAVASSVTAAVPPAAAAPTEVEVKKSAAEAGTSTTTRAATPLRGDAPGVACTLYDSEAALGSRLYMAGPVVHGFKRGSRELGIPTANLAEEDVRDALVGVDCGIYYGWATIGASGTPYKAVMSIGWNPFFKNEKKAIEPHLLHDFGGKDFYGEQLRVVVTGFLRREATFSSLDALIAAIHRDIDLARTRLDEVPHAAAAGDAFLLPPPAAVAADSTSSIGGGGGSSSTN